VTALEEVDANQREAAILHYLADLPVADIAAQRPRGVRHV